MPKHELHDVGVELLKLAPPATVAGLTLNDWVMLATLLYVILQALYLARKWMREESEWGMKIRRYMDRMLTKPGDIE